MTRFGRITRVSSVLVPLACASVAPRVPAQSAAPNAVATAPLTLTLTRAKPSAVGMSNALVPRLDSVIKAGIADHATPGATIAVVRRGKILALKGYGHTDWAAGAPLATDSTMYDMASLTKVVATTTAAMILEE